MSVIERLLSALDETREQLLVALEPLPDEALQQPGASGPWSVADVLVNLTIWESELVTGLMQIDQGKKPARLLAALAAPESYNRQWHEANQGRDLDRIFDDLIKVRLELEEWLEMFPDRALTDKKRYGWSHGRSLADIVTQTTIENERRYLPQIERFAGQWTEAAAGDTIPLTAVTVPKSQEK